MRNQLTLMTAAIFGLTAFGLVAGPFAGAQGGAIAVVDNARVFDESNQGRAATQQIQANVDSWQQRLTALQTEVQGLISQRQQQGGIMTPEALRQLNMNIEDKQVELQRLRENAQREATAIQNQILGELEGTITPVIAELATEMGYTTVLNTETPGLLYHDASVDITNALIARLNGMDQ
ncbi:MAG: OmpH family outer membrane protein [Acidobacteriota bacterium]|jgi:Skp family chaperone for outer membrane proteins